MYGVNSIVKKKKKDIFSPVKYPDRLTEYWKREKVILSIICVTGIIYNIGLTAGPIFQGRLIDALFQKQSSIQVIKIALLFVSVISLVQVARYYKRFYIRRFANNTAASMRQTLYHSLLGKSALQLSEENMGGLMTKAISDVDICVEGMRKFTTEVFDTGVVLISYLAVMLHYEVKMTMLSCLFIPIAIFIAEKMKKVIYTYTSAYRKEMSKLTENTYDMLNHVILYRLNSREEANELSYNSQLNSLGKAAVYANVWENAMPSVYNAIAMSGVLFVITLGGKYVMEGKFSIGVFSTYLALYTAMAAKASKAAKLFNSMQKAMVSWDRIKPYLSGAKNVEFTNIYEKTPQTVELHINSLSFSYDGNEFKQIRNLNLSAKQGMIVGITGPIACGKTTFGKLFIDDYKYQGSIRIGNNELSDLSQEKRSKIISHMGHNPHLLSDTIYENITLGEDGDIKKVLRDVCFEEDLKQMPDGIMTVVGNHGVRLSGGQQARISLARALYHHKGLMILDDPFSAVDRNTEEHIISYLNEYKDNSLIIIISHRFKVFETADMVVMMNRDHTFDYGTHEQLLNQSKEYRELYNLQMGENKNEK